MSAEVRISKINYFWLFSLCHLLFVSQQVRAEHPNGAHTAAITEETVSTSSGSAISSTSGSAASSTGSSALSTVFEDPDAPQNENDKPLPPDFEMPTYETVAPQPPNSGIGDKPHPGYTPSLQNPQTTTPPSSSNNNGNSNSNISPQADKPLFGNLAARTGFKTVYDKDPNPDMTLSYSGKYIIIF